MAKVSKWRVYALAPRPGVARRNDVSPADEHLRAGVEYQHRPYSYHAEQCCRINFIDVAARHSTLRRGRLFCVLRGDIIISEKSSGEISGIKKQTSGQN